MKKIRTTENELIIEHPFATIEEYKSATVNNDNVVRVYCNHWDDKDPVFNFQIRTYKGIGEFSGGKPRNMIATTSISLSEMKAIVTFMEKELQ